MNSFDSTPDKNLSTPTPKNVQNEPNSSEEELEDSNQEIADLLRTPKTTKSALEKETEESTPNSPLNKFILKTQPPLLDKVEDKTINQTEQTLDNSLWSEFLKEIIRPDKAPEFIARNESEKVQHFLNVPRELEKVNLV